MTPGTPAPGPTGPVTSFRGDPAGIVSRAIAFIIDAIVISLAASITGYAISSVLNLLDLGGTRDPERFQGVIALGALLATIAFVYFTAAFWLFGRTVGKLTFGLRVVRADGGRPHLGQAVVRTLGYVVSSFLMLGFIAIALSRQRRAWHDRLARTWCVYDWEAHPRLAGVDGDDPLAPTRLP